MEHRILVLMPKKVQTGIEMKTMGMRFSKRKFGRADTT